MGKNKSYPIQIGELSDWDGVSMSDLVVKTDGSMWAWGDSGPSAEEKIREANPFVKDLYDQYRVALILAGGEDL